MIQRQEGALGVGVIAAGGLLLRAVAAWLRQPWHDEYFTVWVAKLPWREVIPTLAQDSGPPLLYAITKLIASVGLPPLAAARTVTVLAGVAAILVGAHAARTMLGPRAAPWAAALLAFHPLAVAWSCEGRAYALLLLATTLVWNALAQFSQGQRGSGRLAAGISLALWSHGLGVFLLATVMTASLLLPKGHRSRAMVAAGVGLLSFLPWLPVMVGQPPASLAWMQRAWHSLPAWHKVLAPVAFLVPAAPFATALDLPSAPQPVALAVAALTLGLLTFAVVGSRRGVLLSASLVFLPASALVVAANLSLPVFYPGRGEALYLAPAMGLLATGASRGRFPGFMAGLLVIAGALTSGFALLAWVGGAPRPEVQLARSIAAHLPTGGTVLIEGYWRLGLWYHLREAGARFQLETFPPSAHPHPGWYEGGATPADAEEAFQRLVAELQRGNAVGCVLPPRGAPGLLRTAAATAGLAPVATTPVAEVWVAPGAFP